jgi:uncharacterized protein with PIN domain
MNSPYNIAGLMRVTNTEPTEEFFEKLYISIAKVLQTSSNYCMHCGTKLKPWEPEVVIDGKKTREQTEHKWCPGCGNVLYNRLIAYLDVPEVFRV